MKKSSKFKRLRKLVFKTKDGREKIVYGKNKSDWFCKNYFRMFSSGVILKNLDLRKIPNGDNMYLSSHVVQNCKLNFRQIPQNKKIRVYKKLQDKIIATLIIPKKAKRTKCIYRNKCRAEYAFVEKLEYIGEIGCKIQPRSKYLKCGYSNFDPGFTYPLGEIVRPRSYNEHNNIECTEGIHFFMTKEEAIVYVP